MKLFSKIKKTDRASDEELDKLSGQLRGAYQAGIPKGWPEVSKRIRVVSEGETFDQKLKTLKDRNPKMSPRRLAWVASSVFVVVLAFSTLLVGVLNGFDFLGTPTPTAGAILSPTSGPSVQPTIDISDQAQYITVKVDPVMPLSAQSNALSTEYVDSLKTIGTRLLDSMTSEAPGTNLMISPVSLSMCFSMLLPGAVGDTRDEMISALGYGGMDLETILTQNRLAYENLYRNDGPLQVQIANSLWCMKDYPFEKSFLDTASTDFYASIRAIDWASGADPLKLINRWTSDHTNGKIPQLLRDLDPSTVLVLVNTLMFKGDWTIPFDSEMVSNGPFTKANGTIVQTAMMGGFDSFRYLETADSISVALTYKNGMAMIFTLPKQAGSIEGMSIDLLNDIANWEEWKQSYIAVRIPKFQFSSELKLPAFMQQLGMKKAFSQSEADFSKISPVALTEGLCISDAIQKTYIAVTEKGTEAEAATAVVMEGGKPEVVSFDRPFWFTIMDEQGVPLFMGTVQDPTENQ